MLMLQEMRVVYELTQELVGGCTTTVFPAVERWLQESSDRQYAIRVMSRNVSTDYQSVVDFVYAGVFNRRAEVVRFYEGKGPSCRDMYHVDEIQVMEATMVVHLEVAYQLWLMRSKSTWKQVREVTTQLMAA